MPVPDVWFWLPWHMLQAYPMVRNLPFPDFMIPFAHLIWVPFYIWEHWAGLCDPVEEAWAMQSIIVPISGILLLSFFYITHQMSDSKMIVKGGIVLYFGFMLGAKPLFGFKGSPMKTYESQAEANADPAWNNQHLILHVWYLVILWVVALTVPYKKLSAIRCGVEPHPVVSSAPEWFQSVVTSTSGSSTSIGPDVTLTEVYMEVIQGKYLIPEFATLNRTSKFLILQGLIYVFTGLIMLILPNSLFNKIMFFPEPFTAEELPIYRTAGFTLFAVGYYFMTLSRTNHPYWHIVAILPRIVFVIPVMLTLYFFWDAPIQLAGTFIILDPSLAYLTFLSMKADAKDKKSDVVGEKTQLIS